MHKLDIREGDPEILTDEAIGLVVALEREFGSRRRKLLEARAERQRELDTGYRPNFLEETRAIREADWKIASVPADLQDRRVEITGPPSRKMVINALNSGAKTFMADFEDSNAPTWQNLLDGQRNLRDAVRGTISFTDPKSGKQYELGDHPAVLLVRPRGWHLQENNITLNGEAISGSIFDFALYMFHNATTLLEKGSGPYFYLPKLESHIEARLWNDIFVRTQELLNIPQGSIKATVLIETILAAFEMDEILYELRDHMAGLNCGRWDYIFSFIKRFRAHPAALFPDRSEVSMSQPFMHAYSLLAIQTCHKRGAHAIGGISAQIPIKNDPEANSVALEKVREDKRREATDGHDGTWVAHPGLVAIALEEFDRLMPEPNQVNNLREDIVVTAEDLLEIPAGNITEAGLRQNISVGVQYMASWLSGNGCVPLYNLMEDAATAEISRTQLWQWIHHPDASLDDGRKVTVELFKAMLTDELDQVQQQLGQERFEQQRFPLAIKLFDEITTNPELEEFLTLRAYKHLESS